MTTYKVKSDVNKDYYFIEALTLRQGEKGHVLEWEVYENGVQFANIGGYTINLRAETPSGKMVVQSGSFVSGSTVRINLPDAVTGEFGEFRRFYLEISSGTYKVTTPDIKVFVLPVADLTATAAQDYIDKVQQVIDEVLANYDEYVDMIDEAYLNELLQLQNAFATAKGQLDKAVSDFKVQITNETNELSALITNLTNKVNQTVETINNALASMQTEINGLSDQVDGLQALMDQIVAEGAMTKEQADTYYMRVNGVITNQDFNGIRLVGSYSINNATGANRPVGIDYGTLLVLGGSAPLGTVQVAIGEKSFQYRKLNADVWGSWTKTGTDIDTSIYFRTWEDFVTDGRQFSEFYVQGSYAVLLTGEQIPTDSPVQEFEPPLMGWLEVNKMYNAGGSTTDLVMQKVYFPTLKKAFQRIQTNSVPEGQEANITWSNWASLGGAEPATVEEIIIGERDDVVVTPKALAEAVTSDNPVVRANDLNQLGLLSGILNLNIDSYIGTEGQMTGVVPNKSTLGFGSTKQSLRPSDNMTVRNSDGSITVNQSGNYLFFVQCWFQCGSTVNGYVYFNMLVNGARAGGQDRLFGTGSDTLKNRHDGTGMYIRTLNAGDKLNVNLETSIKSGFSSLGAKMITIVKLS